ncbi:hypothetical protein PHISCL_11143, partial [Aspergillus sclerotialis]
EDLVFRVQGRGKEFAVSYRIPKSSVVGGGEQAWKSNGDVHGHNADEPAIFYDEGEQKAVLTASSPSRSGKYWAFTTSDAGADWGVIRVMD